MKTRLITTYTLSLFDLVCTLLLVRLYGIGIEANPIGTIMLSFPPLLIAYKVIGVGVCLWVLYRLREHRAARIGLSVCLCVYSALAMYHVAILVALGG